MDFMVIINTMKFVLGFLRILIGLYKDHYKSPGRQLKNQLDSLVYDLDSLMHDLKFNKEDRASYDELLLTELIYDIEDFAQGLWIPGLSGPVLSLIGEDPREDNLEEIKKFKKRMENLKKPQQKISEWRKSEQGGGCSAATTSSADSASSSAPERYTPEPLLVGITKPKEDLLELLKKTGGRNSKQWPKVICIVGCPGVGKTALARTVYKHYVASAGSTDFDCVAWVEDAGCNNQTVLIGKILEKVQADLESRASTISRFMDLLLTAWKWFRSGGDDSTVASPDLQGILTDKRYLVIIDDVQQVKVLKDIVHDHFPENDKSNMVIVTTRAHSVADVCSSGSYVYTMKCLSESESIKLLCRQAFDKEDATTTLLAGLKSIVTNCGGLPLGLISMAECLRINTPKIDYEYCDSAGKEYGSHYLAGTKGKGEFRKLRRALEQFFEDLPGHDHKTYMLSLSIFPRNHPIKTKSLVRRSIAERLVANSGPETFDELIRVIKNGRECLEELVNRCIVEPEQICSWSRDVKRCKVNGGMMEFIILMSQPTNLVTLIRGEELVRNKEGRIRRLSVQSSTKEKFHEVERKIGLRGIRSLTIFSENLSVPAKSDLFKKEDCKFLRLLDLEGCKGVDDEYFLGICKLVYLKYLSVRSTNVKKIPQEIKNLKCLETLDIRNTREMKLPEEVITLPKLNFLFGMFVLPEMSSKTRDFFLNGQSELHTLGEFIVEEEMGFEHIILAAKNLKKVKVWFRTCCYTTARTLSWKKMASVFENSRLGSKQNFIQSLQEHFTSLDSLSIRSNQICQDILPSLEKEESPDTVEKSCSTISRMKLRGELVHLPGIGTLRQLNNLRKLQLSYTGLTSEVLSAMQHLPDLEYLKLQENKAGSWGGSFLVYADGFQSLRRLCFEALKLPKLEFKTGSMKSLTSLFLLCRDISQMQDEEIICTSISHITSLNEVILHSCANSETMKAWKMAAKGNTKWPFVKQLSTPINAAP